MANGEAVLRGFDMAVPDIRDQLHFRLPLLSFRGDSAVYVARRVDWDDRQALAIVDDPEDLELATLLADNVDRCITSGEGVVVAGTEFFRAASLVGVQLPGFVRHTETDGECWFRSARLGEFDAWNVELINESRVVFDRELGQASRQRRRLAEYGDAALLILRRCWPLRQEDLAMRQLAAARQNGDIDLYRRLLARFEFKLGEPEDQLHRRVERHVELTQASEGTDWSWLSADGAPAAAEKSAGEARNQARASGRKGGKKKLRKAREKADRISARVVAKQRMSAREEKEEKVRLALLKAKDQLQAGLNEIELHLKEHEAMASERVAAELERATAKFRKAEEARLLRVERRKAKELLKAVAQRRTMLHSEYQAKGQAALESFDRKSRKTAAPRAGTG